MGPFVCYRDGVLHTCIVSGNKGLFSLLQDCVFNACLKSDSKRFFIYLFIYLIILFIYLFSTSIQFFF